MTSGSGRRVAVIGASGIGKHHAKWWAHAGADVCAFAGTSPESVAKTREALSALFGFNGRGYTSVEKMLETEQPAIVDVCSPPPLHARHVRTALEAGCHVLCEKPFVYDPALPRKELMETAATLAALAQRHGRLLSVSTQYAAAALSFSRLWEDREPVVYYHGHLESPARNRPPDPNRVWVDLSPHPLSVLLKLAPEGEILWDTLDTRFAGYEAIAEFDVRQAHGNRLHAVIVTRNALAPPLNVRHFKYNGYPFVVEGENDENGVYRARIETPNGSHIEPDMLHASIVEFLRGKPVAGMEESLRNLDWMLRIRDAAQEALR
ncbi:MAG TPA: Gfo/Idh/MocA family oxidoreductase [Candidatus Hydrogenedentes bacterium]|nr:Gfo/Idh/MocA family oxidoreductase [Candidatus Hydrogenedentota bacterium]